MCRVVVEALRRAAQPGREGRPGRHRTHCSSGPVEFLWPHDGFCSGQFTVNVTETLTEVRVGEILSQEPNRGQACGGIGTGGTFAVTTVRLATPLGGRVVVRAGDSQPLPVLPLATLYKG